MNYLTFKKFSLRLRSVKNFLLIILPIALLIGYFFPSASSSLNTIGVSLIKLITFPAIPLVLSAVVISITSLFDFTGVNTSHNKFAKKLILSLIGFIFFSAALGLFLSLFIKPGILTPEGKLSIGKYMLDTTDIQVNIFKSETESLVSSNINFFQTLIPTNIISDAANSSTLRIITGSILTGLGLAAVPSEKAKPILSFLKSVNALSVKVLEELLVLSPVMLICLIAGAFSSISTEIIVALLNLALCVLVGSIAFLGISKVIFRKFTSTEERNILSSNPLDDVYLLAISTGSSMACYPTIVNTLKNIGRDPNEVEASASMSLLLARLGNIIYNVIVIIFAFNLYDVRITPLILIQALLMGIVTGIATAGLTGVAVLPSIGVALAFFSLPIPPILLLIVAIDPIIDLLRSSITGVSSMALSTVVCRRGVV